MDIDKSAVTGRALVRRAVSPILGIVIIACFACGSLQAQEVSPSWTLEAENSEMPLQAFGTFDNQSAAVVDILSIPGPQPNAGDAYSYAKEIKSTEITTDGKVKITYWMGKDQPLDPDWTYPMFETMSSEEESLNINLTPYNSDFCMSQGFPAASGTPLGDWHAAYPGLEGKYEQ